MFLVSRARLLVRVHVPSLPTVCPSLLQRAALATGAQQPQPPSSSSSLPPPPPPSAGPPPESRANPEPAPPPPPTQTLNWRWKSFRPLDCYPGLELAKKVDLDVHHKARSIGDRVAQKIVKLLRIPTDWFFKRRYGHRACMLETVAAVPGMIGGMFLHFRSLRRFEESRGWIRALLEEAENERMHLQAFMAYSKPGFFERMLVIATQGVFATAYAAVFVISPKTAHRIVGYLEEEAIHSYTEFLRDIDAGKIENVPAPEIAKAYWCLPENATLRDMVVVVRADEAAHRDLNHYRANLIEARRMDVPAPLGHDPNIPSSDV